MSQIWIHDQPSPTGIDGLRVGMGGAIRIESAMFAAPPSVTVTADSDGSEVTTGTATAVTNDAEPPVTVAYEIEIPALERPDLLHAVWEGDEGKLTTVHEVTGGPICTVAQVRSMLRQVRDDADAAFSDEQIAAARDYAQQRVESICGVSFRPRYARERIEATDRDTTLLKWPYLIEVLTIDGEEATAPPSEIGELTGGPWTSGAEVTYIHGHREPPGEIVQATARLARHYAIVDPSDLDERATSKSSMDAHWTLITPGVRGATTPLPEVNEVIKTYQFVGGIA